MSLSPRWTRTRPKTCCSSCGAGGKRGEPSWRCCTISTEYVNTSPRPFCWRACPSLGEIPRFRLRVTIWRAPEKRSVRRTVVLDELRERTVHGPSNWSFRDIRLYARRARRVLRSRAGKRADRYTSAHAPRESGCECTVARCDARRGHRLSLRWLFVNCAYVGRSADGPCRGGFSRTHGTGTAGAAGRKPDRFLSRFLIVRGNDRGRSG